MIYSEMPVEEIRRDGGRVHDFQVWVNLPAQDKIGEAIDDYQSGRFGVIAG